MEVGIVELAEDLASFNLSEGDLLLYVVENHQEMIAFLCVAGVVVSHCHDCAVVLHDDSRELEWDVEFLAKSDEKVDFLSAWVEEVATAVCLTLRL